MVNTDSLHKDIIRDIIKNIEHAKDIWGNIQDSDLSDKINTCINCVSTTLAHGMNERSLYDALFAVDEAIIWTDIAKLSSLESNIVFEYLIADLKSVKMKLIVVINSKFTNRAEYSYPIKQTSKYLCSIMSRFTSLPPEYNKIVSSFITNTLNLLNGVKDRINDNMCGNDDELIKILKNMKSERDEYLDKFMANSNDNNAEQVAGYMKCAIYWSNVIVQQSIYKSMVIQ